MITITQDSSHSIKVNVQPISLSINHLQNVVITNPQNGDVLKYDSTLAIWYNTQP